MKILVASDSHGLAQQLLNAISREQPDALLFLGDGARDLLQVRMTYPELKIEMVRGNCDDWSSGKEERLLQLNGFSILMLHGHTRGVKRNREKLHLFAKASCADLVLFGHTHIPTQEVEDGICYLNPGSIGQYSRASYGIVTLNDSIQCQLTRL